MDGGEQRADQSGEGGEEADWVPLASVTTYQELRGLKQLKLTVLQTAGQECGMSFMGLKSRCGQCWLLYRF